MNVSVFVFAKHTKRQSDARDATDETLNAPLLPQILLFLFELPFPQRKNRRAGGTRSWRGVVVKTKIGELEEEVRAGNSRRTRKELTGVVQGVSGRRRLLVRFKNGCKNNLSSNQLTVLIVENIPVEEEPLVSTIPEIPEDQV